MAKLTNEEIIATLKEMTILEVNDLVKAIEEEFGVTASAPVAVTPVAVDDAPAAGPTEVDVYLKEVGQTKIAVIKAVKEATGLSLMEAKTIVDKCAPDAPALIKEKVKVEDADALKQAIVEAGGVVEFK